MVGRTAHGSLDGRKALPLRSKGGRPGPAINEPPCQQVRGGLSGERGRLELCMEYIHTRRSDTQARVPPIRAIALIGKQKRIKMPHFLNYACLL